MPILNLLSDLVYCLSYYWKMMVKNENKTSLVSNCYSSFIFSFNNYLCYSLAVDNKIFLAYFVKIFLLIWSRHFLQLFIRCVKIGIYQAIRECLIMQIIRVKNADEGGEKAFAMIQEQMEKGIHVLGLATGSTPETLYQQMRNSSLDFSAITSINLDEYVGLSGTDSQSYRHFMNEKLFNKKSFKETFVPNGKAEDLAAECQRYDQIIAEYPIDIQILGIGRNGHIGFNEPGTPFTTTTHIVQLTESTIEANKRYFDKNENVPTHAISMGIQSIMQSKQIILMAYGAEKAEAIKGLINGPITERVPASCLQKHQNVTVILDAAAAAQL